MPTPPTETTPTCESVPTARPLAAGAVVVFAAVNLFILGWFAPMIVTRSESSSSIRVTVNEAFGNAPTVGRVFVGRAR